MSVAVLKPSLGGQTRSFLAQPKKLLIDGTWVDAKSGKTFAVEDPATQEIIAQVAERRQGRYRSRGRGGAARLRERARGHASRRPSARRLVWQLGDLLEAACRRVRRARGARQRQAGHQRAPRRCRRLDQHVPLHGRLGDAPDRRDHPGLSARQLVRLHAARADWRRRPDHPVELPADDGRLEARAGARRRLHDRAQARRADAALGAALRRADRWRPAFPTASSTSSPASARRPARARRASRRRQGRLHRLDRGRQADRPGRRRQPEARLAGARRQVAGDRVPGRRPRQCDRRAPPARSSTIRANAARPARACSRTSRSTTRSSRASSRRPASSRSATGSIRASTSARWSPRSSTSGCRASSSPGRKRGRRGGHRRRRRRQPGLLRRADGAGARPIATCGGPRGDLRPGRLRPVRSTTTTSTRSRSSPTTPSTASRRASGPRTCKVAHTLARKIKAGTICVNTHNYGDPAWPFGGYKQSGWGREMGKEVMEHYTETKAVGVRLV